MEESITDIEKSLFYLQDLQKNDPYRAHKILGFAKAYALQKGIDIQGDLFKFNEESTVLIDNGKWSEFSVGLIERTTTIAFRRVNEFFEISKVPGEAYFFYSTVLITNVKNHLKDIIDKYQVVDIIDEETVCIKLLGNKTIVIEKGHTPAFSSEAEIMKGIKWWHFRSFDDRKHISEMIDPIYKRYAGCKIYLVLNLHPFTLVLYPGK